MITLSQLESELVSAMKAKDQLLVDTLRGLKVRLQNEKISKMADLTEEQVTALVKSEIKRRKEAAESFSAGGRSDMAEKELAEAKILEAYMPEQMSEAEILSLVDSVVAAGNFTAADFGKAMGMVKAKVGQAADGGTVARLLKERLR
jgi:uncharacterized protein YqeY